ncbi:MAG TPA: hypothetical protein VFY49_09390 [Myxococcota bacterium]|nr:hypothetical protein [Myxococcota bacterium]
MAEPGQTASPRGARESDLALPEGVEVGLIGGFAVVAVYLVHDLMTSNWLYTPTVLGTLLYSGPDAASMVAGDPTTAEPGVAALYHAAHFAAWMIAGFIASWLVKLAERRPEMRFLPLLGLAALIAFFFALDDDVDAAGIGTLHLWAGGLAGAAATAAYLLWRHPGVMRAPAEEDSP